MTPPYLIRQKRWTESRVLTPEQIARFWSRVQKTEGCWTWMAGRTPFGYGKVAFYRCNLMTHRVAWGLVNGQIPEGMCVLHHCDNPSCVRPEHLFLGTLADNNADMVRKGRHMRGTALIAAQAPTKARGDRNGTRTQPWTRVRGDAHWTRRFPGRAKLSALRGADHYNAKLTWSQVEEIRNLRNNERLTLAELAKRFGMSFQQISAIVNNKTWRI